MNSFGRIFGSRHYRPPHLHPPVMPTHPMESLLRGGLAMFGTRTQIREPERFRIWKVGSGTGIIIHYIVLDETFFIGIMHFKAVQWFKKYCIRPEF